MAYRFNLVKVSICMHAWCPGVLRSADIDYHKWRVIQTSDLWSVCCKHVDDHTAVILISYSRVFKACPTLTLTPRV